VTIRQALTEGQKILDDAAVPGSRLDTELLLAHALGQDRAWLLVHDENELPKPTRASFDQLIIKRADRTPVVHLTGKREFYGLDFEITPSVLTPRVETEAMVEWAIKYAPANSRLIDIGTGSGAIAIAIASRRPDLSVAATEISPQALAVAKRNATTHQAAINFVISDLWDNVSDSFETVVTNLPYLKNDASLMPEVTREPAVALFGGPDGLDLYRRFLDGIHAHTTPHAYLFTESDPWQHDELTHLAQQCGFRTLEAGYFVLGFKK